LLKLTNKFVIINLHHSVLERVARHLVPGDRLANNFFILSWPKRFIVFSQLECLCFQLWTKNDKFVITDVSKILVCADECALATRFKFVHIVTEEIADI